MPIYEFWCPKCEKEFELQRPISDYDKPAVCPDCGSEAEKLVSPCASKVEYNLHISTKAFRKREKKM